MREEEGKPKAGKPEPGLDKKYGELVEKILKVFTDNSYLPSSTTHEKLAYDIQRFGWERVKLLSATLTPSQLGRMKLLGARRLAQLKRDDPEKFVRVINELDRELWRW